MQRRMIESDVRMESRDGANYITGYAAKWYRADDPGTEYRFQAARYQVIERISPSAFNRSLVEDDVAALFNHDPNQVLGRKASGTMVLTADSVGLRYDIKAPDTQAGRDVVAMLARGDVGGSSFSFQPRGGGVRMQDVIEQNQRFQIRELTDVKLYDVGPVTFPAYRSTTAGVRSEDAAAVAAELEAWEAEQRSKKDSLSAFLTGVAARSRVVNLTN